MTDSWKKHWADFAEAFVHPLTANGLLSRFVTNPNVTGAYAEAWMRSIMRSMLPGLRISTGAIIKSSDRVSSPRDVPQIDTIIWDPSELPAIFEQGEFALVPQHAVRGIIEIKRTCSDVNELSEQLKKRRERLLHKYRRYVLGVVLSHPQPLFNGELKSNWAEELQRDAEPVLTRLLQQDNAPDTDGIFVMIYYLSQLAGHRDPI